MKKYILTAIIAIFVFSSCEEMFEPNIENILELDDAYDTPIFAQGILLNAYTRIPTNSWSFTDVATDNAVSNDIANGFRRMAEGGWTAINTPVEQWRNSRAAIQHINTFLTVVDTVPWATNETTRRMFADRMRGEALALRALFMYHLLQRHAGLGPDGQLLGVPIIIEPEHALSDFNVPRATFEACMAQLYSDLDSALALLPLDFENITSVAAIPEIYSGTTVVEYNRVFGDFFRGRMTGRIAMAIRAQAALLAASPAFNPDNNIEKWARAANYAAQLLVIPTRVLPTGANRIVVGTSTTFLDGTGETWYANTGELATMSAGVNRPEILWRGNLETTNWMETDHFPPTLHGNGRINPTRNLVEAFPMANGYPIDHPSAAFNPAAPYAGRDPRLGHYITVNGRSSGVPNAPILTGADVITNDGLDRVPGRSTRTGYYMRKLIRQDVNLDPTTPTTQRRFTPHIRYTEIFLIYAEAANEAFGPMGTGPYATFSAVDVIRAIRQRAGVGFVTAPPAAVANNHAYLNSISGDQAAMRDLIRNERRLELAFEGFRFWDLRRWNMPLDEPALGTRITGGVLFEEFVVENRVFAPHMRFGPIPHSETLKYNALIQNDGW